ncbi:septation ring formation regulator EzrA [Bacillus alveayuensis]|uniref:septation ring formation regulator EzrA n=1 Tax=Aeribacillus alveayuensis TaxID=279215 RepID=UPI0005D1202F|nr:septation ring formation regulator EzrA [Bacillus alveayuensis]
MEVAMFILLLITGVMIYIYTYRKRLYQEIERLESWKLTIMNRPVTDELSKVKQLNMTGQTEELFERWRNSWDEIVISQLPDIEVKLFDIEELIDKHRYKKAKEMLRQAEQMLRKVEEEIQIILQELQELVGSEEKNRIEIEELKGIYRNIKKTLLAHRHTFGDAGQKLEQKVEEMQKKFQSFEELTKHGNYLDAREIVLSLRNELNTLSQMLKDIPELLTECQTVIPTQLAEILEGYQEMLEQGYILEHLQIEKEIEAKQQKIAQYVEMIAELRVEEAKSEIVELKEDAEALYDLLEKEVLAYQYIKAEMNNIEEKLHSLNDETKETKEETLFVQQSYRLSREEIERYRQFEKQINQLIKRFALVRVKAVEKQTAYSLIKEELEELDSQVEAVKEQHLQFREMLQMLRKDELAAREKVNEMKKKIAEAMRLVKKSRLPGLPEAYKLQLDEAKDSLMRVALRLEEKPLNMEAVNQALDEAIALVQRIYDLTIEMLEQAELAEKVIQYGNRYRSRYRSVSEGLEEAELSFRSFEYELALEQAVATIEKVEPGAFQRIQELINQEKNKE